MIMRIGLHGDDGPAPRKSVAAASAAGAVALDYPGPRFNCQAAA